MAILTEQDFNPVKMSGYCYPFPNIDCVTIIQRPLTLQEGDYWDVELMCYRAGVLFGGLKRELYTSLTTGILYIIICGIEKF